MPEIAAGLSYPVLQIQHADSFVPARLYPEARHSENKQITAHVPFLFGRSRQQRHSISEITRNVRITNFQRR